MTRAALVGLAVVSSALLLSAQTSTSTVPSPVVVYQSERGSHPTSALDANQRALEIVNTANIGQIQMGEYMQQHANNRYVKQYAREVTNDHHNAEDKLKADMGNHVTDDFDTALQEDNYHQMEQLQELSGNQEDNTFLRDEISDHQEVISQLQHLEPEITDPRIKRYVEQTIPMLEKHLADARKAESYH